MCSSQRQRTLILLKFHLLNQAIWPCLTSRGWERYSSHVLKFKIRKSSWTLAMSTCKTFAGVGHSASSPNRAGNPSWTSWTLPPGFPIHQMPELAHPKQCLLSLKYQWMSWIWRSVSPENFEWSSWVEFKNNRNKNGLVHSSCLPQLILSIMLCYLARLPPEATLAFCKGSIYLYIWLCQVLVVACGIFSGDLQTFSCGMWDLLPWSGIEPRPPPLDAWSLSHWIIRKVPFSSPFRSACFISFSMNFEPYQ